MIFFDFLYYLIYKFYHSYNEKGAASTSAGIIGGFQTLNVITGIMVFELVFNQKGHLNKPVVIILFLVFQVYNYYRYIYKNERSIEIMEQVWLKKADTAKRLTSNLLLLYGIASLILGLGIPIYVGLKK